MPLFSDNGELSYMRCVDNELILYNLKDQYMGEEQLYALLNFLTTLERIGFL